MSPLRCSFQARYSNEHQFSVLLCMEICLRHISMSSQPFGHAPAILCRCFAAYYRFAVMPASCLNHGVVLSCEAATSDFFAALLAYNLLLQMGACSTCYLDPRKGGLRPHDHFVMNGGEGLGKRGCEVKRFFGDGVDEA